MYYISGEIDDNCATKFVDWAAVNDSALTERDLTVVYLSTNGGFTQAANIITEVIRKYPNIRLRCAGIVSSCGLLIMLGCASQVELMATFDGGNFHAPWRSIRTDEALNQFEESYAFLDRNQNKAKSLDLYLALVGLGADYRAEIKTGRNVYLRKEQVTHMLTQARNQNLDIWDVL